MRTPTLHRAVPMKLTVLVALTALACSKHGASSQSQAGPAPAAGPHVPLDVPVLATAVVAKLEQTHVRVRFRSDSAPGLAGELAVPKDWTAVKSSTPPSGTTVSLGKITGPAKWGSPEIEVSVITPGFEIPLDAWLRTVFAHGGYTMASAKWFPAPSLFFDATGTRTRDGVEEVRRTAVRAAGGHIYAVTCLVPRAHWDDTKGIFWVAIDSFEPLSGKDDTRLETWMAAEGKAPDFELAYPASWKAEPVASPPKGVSAVDVRLTKDERTLLAYLQVRVERLSAGPSIAPLERLRETGLEALKKAGFVPSGDPVRMTEADDPRSIAVPGWLGGFRAEGHMGTGDAAMWMGFVRHDGYLARFLAIAPTAHDDNMMNLRGQRAFEIARATLEVK